MLNSIGYTVQDENQGVKKLTLRNSYSSETKICTERDSGREKRNELLEKDPVNIAYIPDMP